MPLTRARLEELARAETVHIGPENETNCTRAEWKELVEAKKALAPAGLEPGDVATLVELVRRFDALDDGDQSFCWKHAELWAEAHALIERLPL